MKTINTFKEGWESAIGEVKILQEKLSVFADSVELSARNFSKLSQIYEIIFKTLLEHLEKDSENENIKLALDFHLKQFARTYFLIDDDMNIVALYSYSTFASRIFLCGLLSKILSATWIHILLE